MKIFGRLLIITFFVPSKIFTFFEKNELKYLQKIGEATNITLIIKQREE
jgi:hypothetical protein